MIATNKRCATCGETVPDGTCPDCDPNAECVTVPAARLGTTLATAIAQAQDVIDQGGNWTSNAYVFTRPRSRQYGFFFAHDDAAADDYKARMETAEGSHWLIVAMVPGRTTAEATR